MKIEDLIIKKQLRTEEGEFEEDFVSLQTKDEIIDVEKEDLVCEPTNFSKECGAYVNPGNGKAWYWLGSMLNPYNIHFIKDTGSVFCSQERYKTLSLRPTVVFDASNLKKVLTEDDISVENKTIKFGEYPQTKLNESKAKKAVKNSEFVLEDEIFTTFKDEEKIECDVYSLKGSKYIEYNGSYFKFEPIEWKILNFEDAPKFINPHGTGKSKGIVAVTDKAIIAGLPYFSKESSGMLYYNKSVIREYLNDEFLMAFENSLENIISNENDLVAEQNPVEEDLKEEAPEATTQEIVEKQEPKEEVEEKKEEVVETTEKEETQQEEKVEIKQETAKEEIIEEKEPENAKTVSQEQQEVMDYITRLYSKNAELQAIEKEFKLVEEEQKKIMERYKALEESKKAVANDINSIKAKIVGIVENVDKTETPKEEKKADGFEM